MHSQLIDAEKELQRPRRWPALSVLLVVVIISAGHDRAALAGCGFLHPRYGRVRAPDPAPWHCCGAAGCTDTRQRAPNDSST